MTKKISPLFLLLFTVALFLGCAAQKQEPRLSFAAPGPILLASMGYSDLEKMHEVFESTPSYDVVSWENNTSKTTFQVKPMPVYREGELVCRRMIVSLVQNGRETESELSACRIDGIWQVTDKAQAQ